MGVLVEESLWEDKQCKRYRQGLASDKETLSQIFAVVRARERRTNDGTLVGNFSCVNISNSFVRKGADV